MRCVLGLATQAVQGRGVAHGLQWQGHMLMRVTCPESAHLEVLEVRREPRRLTVLQCSAFGGCELSCERTCVARLNRKLFGETAARSLAPGTVLLARSCLGR